MCACTVQECVCVCVCVCMCSGEGRLNSANGVEDGMDLGVGWLVPRNSCLSSPAMIMCRQLPGRTFRTSLSNKSVHQRENWNEC